MVAAAAGASRASGAAAAAAAADADSGQIFSATLPGNPRRLGAGNVAADCRRRSRRQPAPLAPAVRQPPRRRPTPTQARCFRQPCPATPADSGPEMWLPTVGGGRGGGRRRPRRSERATARHATDYPASWDASMNTSNTTNASICFHYTPGNLATRSILWGIAPIARLFPITPTWLLTFLIKKQ